MSSVVEQKRPAARGPYWILPFLVLAAAVGIPRAHAQVPINDIFTNAIVITGPQGALTGSNLGATRETNEPIHWVGSPLSSNSVWYSWTAPQDGIVTFDTKGTGLSPFGFDTVIAAYRSIGTNGVGSLGKLASDDDSGGPYGTTDSLMRFPVTAGTNYFIAVDGFRAGPGAFIRSEGDFNLQWSMGVTSPPIVIPPDVIQFAATNFFVLENQLLATITVWYGGDSSQGANGPVSVDYYTTNGTAIDGLDYVGTSGTLVFAPGEQIKTFDVVINDNLVLNNNRTVGLVLANPTNAFLAFGGDFATLTIVDDEAPILGTSGTFTFSSISYFGTENETFEAPFAPPISAVNQVFHPSAQGVLVTVIRLPLPGQQDVRGRVMVDYITTNNTTFGGPTRAAKPNLDYLPQSGTLIFDDYQMSATFFLQVGSDGASNNFSKSFDVVLSNARPAPEEELTVPDAIVPYISTPVFSLAAPLFPVQLPILPGAQVLEARARVDIREVNERFRFFNIERSNYREHEYIPTFVDGPTINTTRTVRVDVILPGGGGGSIPIRLIRPARGYSLPISDGSDYIDPDPNAVIFPNTLYTDGASTITNEPDIVFQDRTITFPANGPGSLRQTVTFTITNDNTVEFNEDLLIELHDPPQGFGIGPNLMATSTILFDDQPAGAAHREWNPEGIARTQPPFNTTPGANNTVNAVASQPDNRTVVVGSFTAMNSVPINRVARLNPDGSLDTSFKPGTGADAFVETVAVYTNVASPNFGKILIGGGFSSFNGRARSRIARLNRDGSLDTTFNPGNGANRVVNSIVLQSDEKILVAGDFTLFNDLPVTGLMRLNDDGTLDTTFNPGTGANGSIFAMAVRDVGGTVFSPRSAVGTELEDVNVIDTGANRGTILIDYNFLAIEDNIRIYYDGVRIFDLTTNLTGNLVIPYGPGLSTEVTIIMNEGTGIPGTVWGYTARIQPVIGPRTIYVAGNFTGFNGQPRRNVARLLSDGSVDPSFDPGIGPDGPIYALGLQANNRLLIGGAFTSFHTQPRSSIARLRSNGALDPDYHVGSGADDEVYTITIQPDGKALIGGIFTSYNGTRRMGLARLFERGPLDTSFLDTAYNQFAGLIKTFSFEPPRYVNSIALRADGNVMIGGSFTNLGGNFSYDHGQFLTTEVKAPHVYAPFTRADKVTRFNVACLVGGYTPGPGNVEYDPNAQPFTIDENAGFFAATMRRVDGRLGTAAAVGSVSNNTATLGDFSAPIFNPSWTEWAYVAPRSVGLVSVRYLPVTILDDTLREGDETFFLQVAPPLGAIVLGGTFVPLGVANGHSDFAPVTITDNDFDHGIFHFAVDNFVTNENAVVATISVVRTNGSVGDVSVDYLLQDETAQAGQDYVNSPPVARRLTFRDGETNRTFDITILNNPEVENDETIRLVLTNASGGATLPGGSVTSIITATLTIVDDDFLPGRLNFTTTNYAVSETEGFAVVTVTRTGGNVGLLQVDFATSDGTATAGSDYGATNGTLRWNSGDVAPKTFIIPLYTDGTVEGTETVNIRLIDTFLTGALGNRTNAVLNIIDGDNYGTLSFSQPFYNVGENDAAPHITVVRNGGIAGTVSVEFTTSPGDAVIGTDYLPTNGVLTFLPGQISQTFQLQVLDDSVIDSNKFFSLILTNPVNASLGRSNVLVTIIDNESLNTPAGSLDTTFSTNASANGAVYALALQTNGAIVMAGDFTEVGSVPRNRLARLHGDGALDFSFDIGPGADGPIRTLALQSDGRLLVGGLFTSINGTNLNGLARLTTDGKVDGAFNPGAGADNPVLALTVQPDDKVLVGGSFSTFRSVTSPGLVRLNTNGTIDISFNIGAGFNGTVYAVELQFDGKILVAGNFISYDGIAKTNLVRLNVDGSLDTNFNPGFTVDAPIRALLAEPDGRILIGGSFNSVNGATRRYLARLNQDGTLDTGFLAGPNDGADNVVYAIKQQVDGRLVVAGDFRSFNGVTRNSITRLNDSDGSVDPTINFGEGANAFVAALAIQPDRKIILGGGFTEYDGQPRKFLARIYGGSISGPGTLDFAIPPDPVHEGVFTVSENQTNAVITVRRRGGTTGTVTVHYATSNETAIAGQDYLHVEGDLIFEEGETFRRFSVPILPNTIADGDRTLRVDLSNFVGASPGPQPSATLLIIDDESLIRFTSIEYSASESPVNGAATIGVFRGGGTNSTVTVGFTTVLGGSAVAGADYITTNGTVTFLPGQIFQNFDVPIVDDPVSEGNETVFLSLVNPSVGSSITISNATLIIVDNDFAPGEFLFSTNNYVVDEPAGSVTVTIIRTNGSSGPASVRLRASDGTAVAGLDYGPFDRLVTFTDGDTVKTEIIPIINNSILEPDEFFNLTLSEPSLGTSIRTPSSIVTIIDDEFGPSYVSFAATNFFGDEVTGFATISVVRTNSRRGVVSVDFSVSNGSATGADYIATNGTLTFNDGDALKTFTVRLINDGIPETAETVNLHLGNLSAGFLVLSNATLTILDNPLPLQFSPPNPTVSENVGTAVITVVRQGSVNVPVSVDYSTPPGGTAVAGLHYVPVSGTLSWPAGDASPRTFNIPIIDNTSVNPPRTVSLLLSNASGTANGILTITDDESQAPIAGPVDPTFNENFGANASVQSVAYDAAQRLYVGGDFTQFHGLTVNRVVRLNPNGAIDQSFNAGSGANGIIYAIAPWTNSVYIGGAFNNVNGVARGRIARLFENGAVDLSFAPANGGADAPVRAIAVTPAGPIIIGGDFLNYDGNPASRLARVETNGSFDASFNIGTGPNARVRAVAVQANGQVIIGGDFTAVNGFLVTRIARLNANGSLDTSFQIGLGADGSVNSISIALDGKIIIGGDFTTINGVPRNGVARLNADGSVDTTFNIGEGAVGSVRAVAAELDGHVLVAGGFSTFNGNPLRGVARLNSNGALDATFVTGSGASGPVNAISLVPRTVLPAQAQMTFNPLSPDSTAYNSYTENFIRISGLTGGSFLAVSNLPFGTGAQLNPGAAQEISLVGGYTFTLQSMLFANVTNPVIVISSAGGVAFVTANGFFPFDASFAGVTWVRILGSDTPVIDNIVVSVGPDAFATSFFAIGGDFEEFNGVDRGGVAVLATSGLADFQFDPRNISTRSVYATAIYTNPAQPSLIGKIVAGGDFTALVGVDGVNRLGRLNIDGTLDTSFNTGLGADGPVRAVAVQPDGRVVFGGFFTSYDLIARAYLGRVNADGSLDNSFNFGAGLNNAVLALALQPDGRIIIGGLFTEVYGTTRNSIARVNANGTVDVTFNPGSGANGAVRAVALQADGKVLIGGDFTFINGVPRFHIARLNANGSLDTSFTAGADGSVNAIAVTGTGGILIGGAFTTVNGAQASRVALLTSSGAADPSFNSGAGANDYITSVQVQPDGRFVLGGNFTMFNGQVRNRIVRLNANGSLDQSISFGTGANDVVNSVLLQDYDGKIVIGGSFTEVDGLTRVAIARLFAGTNSGAGTFRFSSPTFTVNEDAGTAQVTVLRTGGAAGSASVSFSTANGTATSPPDYTAISGTLVFGDAETVKFINVPVNNDSATNGNRTFTVSLFNPSAGASVGSPSNAVVTIEDDDAVIGFSAATYLATENGGVARITVTRTGGATGPASVEFITETNGSATAGLDFTPRSVTLTFLPGVRVQTVDIPILNDTLNEFNETVPLTLLNVTGATLGRSSATLTIVEDDFAPGVITFGTNFYFVSEDAGFIAIEVLRTNGFSGSVTVGFQTQIGTATPGADYVATNGILTFGDGTTNAFIIVRVLDDVQTGEGGETVPLQLFGPSGGATLGLGSATLTIQDDDAPGTFVFSRPVYTVSESNAFVTIAVVRTNGNQGAVNVTIQSFGISATPGLDYTTLPSTVLNFADGQTVRTVNVPILQDTQFEGTETFQVLLSNESPGTFIAQPNPATVEIVDDEVSVSFSATDYTVVEALTNVTITVIRVGDTNNAFSTTVSTSDGSATAGADYLATSTTLNFAAGVTSRTFTVAIIGDQFAEGDEFLNLTLSSASGGVALGPIAAARLNILDNDTGFNFSSAVYSTNEGNVSLAITVNRIGFNQTTGSVDFATANGSATAGFGLDYLSAAGTLNFAVGQTSATFVVTIQDDFLVEGNETINLFLSNPTGGSLGGQSTAVIVIVDDDATVGFSPTSYVVNERAGTALITLVRNGASAQPIQVTFRTVNATAIAGLDYGAVNTTVSWAANDLTPKTVAVPIIDDAIAEGAETVNLQLINPVGAAIDPATGTGVLTIVDNAGVIAFASVNYSTLEGSGNALLNLVRTGGSNGVVSVNWNVTGGTATPGQDYFGAAGTVVFGNGEMVKPIVLPIGDDGFVEGIESVNLVLSSAGGGARVGSPAAATLSITDNDAGVIVGAGTALVAESFTPTNNIIEPGETVTILFALRNAGVVDANNVTASLVYSNGVTHTVPQSQNYGALIAGGSSVSRPFTFTALGTNGSRITATLMITNNGLFLGPVSFDFVLGTLNLPFQNATAITINDNTTATPYPAPLIVSGVPGPISKLTVTLHGLSHNFPDDIDILLVGPNGAAVMLMSDAGGGLANALNNVTFTFDDAAANLIPDSTRITNGSYRAANYLTQTDPIAPFVNTTMWTNTSLATFNGTNPNGEWRLYVVDDALQQPGVIANGWSLNITASGVIIPGADLEVTVNDAPDPVTTGGTVTYTISVANHGPAAATSVMLTNVLPPEANFISVAGPGSYTLNGSVLVGNIGSIAANDFETVVVTMTAPNFSTLLTFDSTAGAGQTDLNMGNNHVSIKTTVSSPSPLPSLFAARKNNQLVLSWQGATTNVVLQSSVSAAAGSSWLTTEAVPVVSNGVSTVTLPLAGNTKFFRLRRVP